MLNKRKTFQDSASGVFQRAKQTYNNSPEIKAYMEHYEAYTQEILKQAALIESVAKTKFKVKYSLPDIAYTLREAYKDPEFRGYFTGGGYASGPKWSKGMCARASACIYELYGKDKIWSPYMISLEDWPQACVTFLRDKFQRLHFGTTGEHFYPELIPYDLGMPIGLLASGEKTAEFIQIIKKELDTR